MIQQTRFNNLNLVDSYTKIMTCQVTDLSTTQKSSKTNVLCFKKCHKYLTMMPLFERTAFHMVPSRSSVVFGPDLRRAEKLLS